MPLPTGTATPWQLIEDPSATEDGSSIVTYYRIGKGPGSSELLAEQLRMDGLVRSIGPALEAASSSSLRVACVGALDDGTIAVCSADGWTMAGDQVDEALPCIVACVNTEET